MLKDKDVLFAGLHVITEPKEHILIRIQTNQGTTPQQALVRSIHRLRCELGILESTFQSALISHK